jgi:hypothetical protein
LAIINLFGAHAYTYDENRLDEFRALFTESPQLVMLHDGAELSQDINTVMGLLAARKAAFKAEKNQRRQKRGAASRTSTAASTLGMIVGP